MKVVYAIQHNATKRIYVGVTNVAEHRIKQHLHKLLQGSHTNKEMQLDFDKYGFDYSFFVVEKGIKDNIAFERERYWMNMLGSNGILLLAAYMVANTVMLEVLPIDLVI